MLCWFWPFTSPDSPETSPEDDGEQTMFGQDLFCVLGIHDDRSHGIHETYGFHWCMDSIESMESAESMDAMGLVESVDHALDS